MDTQADPRKHHWDFVDEEGCLHCNCGIGVFEPSPGSTALTQLERTQEWLDRFQGELASKEIELIKLRAEIERLRERIKMLLKCHYEQHEHRGSPTCFDLIEPWETDL